MGNSWLRGRLDGNVSVSGCGEPIPPSTFLLGGVAQTSRALACQARGRRFESGRPRSSEASFAMPLKGRGALLRDLSWWPWCRRKHPGL